ncbi:unnamed protein product [Mycena citricolor]|uniref:Fruit-body specific protein a n=1 Tax=Mycena citricolor TaxID=2018698 RepID=A0AAD2HVP8_9AGAR|nr:unnamed protein product [Mycena citricolor]
MSQNVPIWYGSFLLALRPELFEGVQASSINGCRKTTEQHDSTKMFPSPKSLLFLAGLLLHATADYTLAPALQGANDTSTPLNPPDVPSNFTDADLIANTAGVVSQKTGAPSDSTPPDLAQAPTKLTAYDGTLFVSYIASDPVDVAATGNGGLDNYVILFDGRPDGNSSAKAENIAEDAAIVGTAYLTYKLVSNDSYIDHGMPECAAFCDSTPGCVFFNIYTEMYNPLLDYVFTEKSNLKCVLYGEVHGASEKTNFGGQQLAPPPSPPTKIIHSSGFASRAAMEPSVPAGYELVFGPISAANNAPAYMGFAFLDRYDPSACAQMCNQRQADDKGGACKFFNIWRAMVNDTPKTYTCSMYYEPTNASTATNTGQGDLKVTLSRGYRRISHISDGTFESYTCSDGGVFCFTEQAAGWKGLSTTGGSLDATIFHYAPYAHMGTGCALLGCAFGTDNHTGMLVPTSSFSALTKDKTYEVQLFSSSMYSGMELEANSLLQVIWNGVMVGNVTAGYSDWKYHAFSVTALGGGQDKLVLQGGSAPAYVFIDDVYVFLI